MKGFIGLTKRNLLIYFKDVSAVIFSLLTSIIVFVLYLVFLKSNYVDVIKAATEGLENFITADSIDTLVSGILLVGIVGSAMVTVPYSCLETVIRDRENKIDYDVLATPVRRGQIILSYFTSAVLSAFIVTSVILTVGLAVLMSNGKLYLSFGNALLLYGIVAIGCLSSTAIFLIMALFFKTSASSSAFFGILSAASGFVIGAYIPLSQFSKSVQTVCYLVPATQVTVLFRNRLMGGLLTHINDGIGGVDGGAFVKEFKGTFNFESVVFGKNLSPEAMLGYVLGIFALSLVVLVLVYSKRYKRK